MNSNHRFKLGDRVKVIADIDGTVDEVCIGRTGTITDVDAIDDENAEVGYTVRFDDVQEEPPHDYFWDSELEASP
jgi:hypothetical protein